MIAAKNRFFHFLKISIFVVGLSSFELVGDDAGARPLPARTIPVPTTVSPEMQQIIARPLKNFMSTIPKNKQGWDLVIEERQKMIPARLANVQKLFPSTYEKQQRNGVNTYMVTPQTVSKDNKDFVILHIHGGAYVFDREEGCIPEAIAIASYSQCKTITVDYRMPPESPFPAALDDALAVYTDLIKTYRPENIGLFGTSAGGGLAAALTLKLQELGLPMPAAVILGTPWSDLTKTGDTYFTNEEIDDVLIAYGEFGKATAELYAGGKDLKLPLISPVYGDFKKGYPPVQLVTGTRDLLLSCTVRLHRKFLEAGIDADLQVFEGMSHAFYLLFLETPESKEAFQEMARFFHKHLGQKTR